MSGNCFILAAGDGGKDADYVSVLQYAVTSCVYAVDYNDLRDISGQFQFFDNPGDCRLFLI